MTTYGDTGYYISLSSGIAGASPTHYPTGDIIYLYADEWEFVRENKDKQKEMGNNQSYNNRYGKISRECDLRRCVIYDDDGEASTNTNSLNNKITLLDSWCGISKSAIYLIITPSIDNPNFIQPNTNRVVNVALSRTGTSTVVDYLKGVLRRASIKPRGNVYFMDLKLKETNLL
jgi:hypothetical protein